MTDSAQGPPRGLLQPSRPRARFRPPPPLSALLLLTLLLLRPAPLSEAYPNGAGSCAGPQDGHGPPAAGDGGYSLSTPDHPTIVSGAGPITVSLKGSSPFRGLLLVATSGGAFAGGDVAKLPPGTKFMDCGGSFRAITQSRRLSASEIQARRGGWLLVGCRWPLGPAPSLEQEPLT